MSGRIISFIALIFVLLAATYFLDLRGALFRILDWLKGLGPLAPILFVAIYIVAAVALMPAWPLTIAGGLLFGLVMGCIYVSLGSTLGAVAAFLVSRSLGRDVVAKRLAQSERLQWLDDAIAREGWKIVTLVRLSPIFPYNMVNYLFGLSQIRLIHYAWASWLGMIPATVLYVYIGSAARNLTEATASGTERNAREWVVYGIGLAATLAVTAMLTRLAMNALHKKGPLQPPVEPGPREKP